MNCLINEFCALIAEFFHDDFYVFIYFTPELTAYRTSQARCQIGPEAAGL